MIGTAEPAQFPSKHHLENMTMTEEKKKDDPQGETPASASATEPAHSTEQERERLKDFNKDGIPPGAC